MPEWKSLRESDLAEFVAAEPPAISGQYVGNGYVWTLALLPLLIGVIEAVVSASNQEAAARSLVLGLPYHPRWPYLCCRPECRSTSRSLLVLATFRRPESQSFLGEMHPLFLTNDRLRRP